MYKFLETEQFKTLLTISKEKVDFMLKKVGTLIKNEPHEKFTMYVNYPKKEMVRKTSIHGSWWDIPEYTNGSTRHSKSLWRIKNMKNDGYLVSIEYDKMSHFDKIKYKSEHEKILMTEHFDDDFVEIIWTWDYKHFTAKQREQGVYGLNVPEFYITIRVNGEIDKSITF